MLAANFSPRIGVFDSGVGGLSVLRALHGALPAASLEYVADSGHAPYGEREPGFVLDRSRRIARFLQQRHVQMLVIACNTATAVAVQALRQSAGGLPIVGIEPGIKPAAALTRSGHVGVMATHGTLGSPKFRQLLQQVSSAAPASAGLTFHLQPCAGLAQAIERHAPDSETVKACIDTHAAPLKAAGCDVVVLGCTHYPLAAGAIRQVFGPAVELVDTSLAVARRATALANGLTPAPGGGGDEASIRLWSTGETEVLEALAARSLGQALRASRVQI